MRVAGSRAAVAALVAAGVLACEPGGSVLNPRPEDPGAASRAAAGGAIGFGAGGGGQTGAGAGGGFSGIVAPVADAAAPPPVSRVDAGVGGAAGDGGVFHDAASPPRRP